MLDDGQIKLKLVCKMNVFLEEKKNLFPILEAGVNTNDSSLTWLLDNAKDIKCVLSKYAGVLLRGFDINSLSEFNQFANAFSSNLLDYTFRSTPREKLGGRIYSSTHYPANRLIPQHNENSYTNQWPNFLMFYSVIPATEGGETPIASSHDVYQRLEQSIVEKFKKLGVLYIRNYSKQADLRWQEVFQTENKEEVNQYCKQNKIECIWKNGDIELTTKQVCPATQLHPLTKQEVWFNQAHLFHVSSLPEESRDLILSEYRADELPRNAFYGNGDPIELSVLDHIRESYKQETIQFRWQRGDILVIDNLLASHGRNPFKGERKVAVVMA